MLRLNILLIILLILTLRASGQVFIPFGYYQCLNPASNTFALDNSATTFSTGTFSNTTLSTDSIVLSSGQLTGTYTSSVKDIWYCNQINPWLSHEWTTDLPYGKELPSTSELATDYSGVSLNLMTNLVGLWHLNETSLGTAPGGKDFKDSSANAFHGSILSTGQTLGVMGKLFKGIRLNATTGNYVSIPYNAALNIVNNLTYSIWYYRSGNGSDWMRLIGRNASSASRQFGVWDYGPSNSQAILVQSYGGGCEWSSATASNNFVNGKWYHIVVTLTGGVESLYVNGVLDSSRSGCANFPSDATSPLTFGGASSLHSSVNGILDEAAVWSRALSASEVLQLYRRGANRIKFQIRSCTSNTCSDNPSWLGPDGTSSTYFTEINNNSNQPNSTGNVMTSFPVMTFLNFSTLFLPANRFYQYQATLETDNSTYSPLLKSVKVVK